MGQGHLRSEQPLRVVRSDVDAVGDGVVKNVPGNTFDKHGSKNPIVSMLMKRFHAGLVGAVRTFSPVSLLDVGCGEGRTTMIVSEALETMTFGMDLEEIVVQVAKREIADVRFLTGSAMELPFADGSIDVVLATEVLEHLDSPERALHEMARVARRAIVVTVPHEPWWRMANLARGWYVAQWGNTPGHVQHWSRRSLLEALSSHSESAKVQLVGLWLLGIVPI